MTDSDTTVACLRQRVAPFVATRDWEQFHNPKGLSVAIAIEAAERRRCNDRRVAHKRIGSPA